MATTHPPQTPEEVEREGLPAEDVTHPGPREYVQIAVVLAAVTLLEVLAYYAEQGSFGFELPRSALISLLIVLMVIKFALVVLWYMHLRFDSPLYKRMFLAGIGLALTVFLVVLLTFGAGFLTAVAMVGGTAVLLGTFMVWRRVARP
ncbi:MAG: cytochrome C oxidase subunit IV family protein [Actinomycetota bacterium]